MGNAVRASRGTISRNIAGASLGALAIGLLMPAAAVAAELKPAEPAAVPAPAQPVVTQDAAGQEAPATDEQDIVVTGFRRSLEQALTLKRDSVAAVDAIVAEDIAKFPDQNLAEIAAAYPGHHHSA